MNVVNAGDQRMQSRVVTRLVKFSLDLKAVRQSMPDQYKQMLDMASGGAKPDAAKAMAPAMKSLETVERFEASLDNGEKGIRLAFHRRSLSAAQNHRRQSAGNASWNSLSAGRPGRFDCGRISRGEGECSLP